MRRQGGQRTFKLKTRLQSPDTGGGATKISSSQCAEHVSTTTSRTTFLKQQLHCSRVSHQVVQTCCRNTRSSQDTQPRHCLQNKQRRENNSRPPPRNATLHNSGTVSVRSNLPGVNALPEGSMSTKRRKEKRPRGNRQKSVVCHDGHTACAYNKLLCRHSVKMAGNSEGG